MQRISEVKHSKNAAYLAISKSFERAAYYGIRAAVVLYLVSETINLSNVDALSIYGYFTLGIGLSGFIGALLGDLVLGNKKTALFGGVLLLFGCVILCIKSIIFIYFGLGLIALGSGLYSSNVIARFGNEYLNKTQLLDGAFSMFYSAVNIGSLVGVVTIGYLSDINFLYGIGLASVFYLMSIVLLTFYKEKQSESYNFSIEKKQSRLIKIFVVIIFIGIFWTIYELTFYPIEDFYSGQNENHDGMFSSSINIDVLSSTLPMVVLILFVFIWSRYYVNQFFKLFLGLLIIGIAVFVLYVVPENSNALSEIALLVYILLLSISEALISPLISSITTKYVNPKYLAIMLIIVTIPSMLFNKISGLIAGNSIDNGLKTSLAYGGVILIIISIIAFVFYLKTKKEESVFLSEEAKEFLDSKINL